MRIRIPAWYYGNVLGEEKSEAIDGLFDVTAAEDGLSRKVLESTVSEIAYERTDDPECPNRVTLHIRAE